MKCKAIGCTNNYRFGILKLCNKHYQKFRRYGDENFKMANNPGSGKININFYKNIDKFSLNKDKKSCWIYPCKPMINGYVTICAFRTNGKQMRKLVHRLSYEHFFDKIPNGKTIDHKCRTRACFNPKHLRVLSRRDNVLCGIGLAAINARKKVCKNGHKLSGKNLVVRRWKHKTSRKCRTCNVAWQKNRRKLFPEVFREYERRKRLKNLSKKLKT